MAEKFVGIIPHKTNDLSLNSTATVITTVGGIDITTNLTPSQDKTYYPPKFSSFFTLENSSNVSFKKSLFNPDKKISLSLDKTNAKYFAKYGSLLELLRVSLETIILQYPGAIHSKTNVLGLEGYNIINSGYYYINNTTTFFANTSYFSNPFQLYFQNNENFKFSDDRIPEIRNLSKNYFKYEIVVDGNTYPILEFTPSVRSSNDFVKIKVQGNPFELGNNSKEFYIKPVESEYVNFYDNLEDFEEYLISRDNDYRLELQSKKEVDGGVILEFLQSFEFPRLDDYNLDVITDEYDIFVNDLLEYANNFDEYYGNILMRKFVPDSVQSVTLEDLSADYPTYGEINKLLIVYGRHFDILNQYIEGIRFLNTVNYSNKDSMPDALLLEFVKTLGWDLEENLPAEQLRVLALNSSWIFKSKGTRNAIEFLLKFFGVPSDIVDFNEYVLRAKAPVNVEKLKTYYSFINPDSDFDIDSLPIDENGYPKYFSETDLDYFQRYGLLDRGNSYFYKYINLLPFDFTGSTVSYTETLTSLKNLFNQDFDGTGNTLTYSVLNENLSSGDCFEFSGETVSDPYPEIFLDDCGCPLPISDKAVKICVNPVELSASTTIILDIWYNCISGDTALLHINTYGGTPPFTFYGATGEQIVTSGETYNIYAEDANGNLSDEYSVTINCPDPCFTSDLEINLGYTCILDEFDRNTGFATIDLTHNGTYVSGVQSGETIEHGQIATVIIRDNNGCFKTERIYIDCEAPSGITCDQPIPIQLSIETTSVSLETFTSKVNVVYDIDPVPFNYIIDEVILTVSGSNLVGSPVSEVFNSLTGVNTLDLDFSPSSIPSSITLNVDIEIRFVDSCIYTYSGSLTVNPRILGDDDEIIDTILP